MTTDNESSRPIPLNSATVMNESMLATDVAEARGRSLAIAALMSLSKLIGTGIRLMCRDPTIPVHRLRRPRTPSHFPESDFFAGVSAG